MRPVRFLPLLLLLALVVALACGDNDSNDGKPTQQPDQTAVAGITPAPALAADDWPMFSGSLERLGYNANEAAITKDNVANLVMKWKFPTGAPVAASPAVATIAVPGEGPVRTVVVGSYDGNVYAIRADDGTELWHYKIKPHPGVSYGAIASSAAVALVVGQQRVYVGGGETMYALDAATGGLLWQFDAGTGCTTCSPAEERNEILSSPAVLPSQNMVLFGMDVNDNDPGKGGFYAVSAITGTLIWYFDVETGIACVPNDDDEVRRFDGYHSAQELGLPADFFATRDGCDFDRTETGCGSVWSPVSVDQDRKQIFFVTSNCDTDNDPSTAEPEPPMPQYDEALVVLDYNGAPVWSWRPREVDNDDLAFGAAPNLFSTTIDGKDRDVVGIGGKDGTYYLLDREGKSVRTDKIKPYWQRKLVPGGAIGGITGTPAVMNGVIYIGTAIGESEDNFQQPSAHALDASTGDIIWQSDKTFPYFGGTSAIPGVVFMGGVDFRIRAIDAATGEVIQAYPLGGLGFSQSVVVDGVLYVGSGFGAQAAVDSNEAESLAKAPAGVLAFCVEGVQGCEAAPTPTDE
ncbi:MAG: PQQ-binding-like beta-propeller repeat protein [Dehalococcoidia bacterium]